MKDENRYVGTDVFGEHWLYDPVERRLFCEGDPTPRDQRGYHCDSYEDAVKAVRDEEVP